jgi:catechol 2,3-dioxygenase-like lactoylglutathione lyase family enzyme
MVVGRLGWLWSTAAVIAILACGGSDPSSGVPSIAGGVDKPGGAGGRPGSGAPIAVVGGAGVAGAAGAAGLDAAAGSRSVTGGELGNPAPPSASGGSSGATATATAGAGGGMPSAAASCEPRMVSGEAQLHFHHVHFNSVEPAKDIEFFMKFYAGMAIDFCKEAVTGEPTPAIKSERGYFLFTKVETPPDPALNSHIDHVGFANPSPMNELQRLMMLDVPLWPPGDQLQCMDVADGTACFSGVYFYTQMPNGARIEVSNSPGPSTTGFGHMHLSGPLPDFYMQLLGPALQNAGGTLHVDGVNLTNTLLEMRAPANPVDTKGKPLDHIAYSTGDIDGTLERVKAAGITIEEDLSFKPAYGFKSFMVKSPQGVWIEIVEDSPFQP